MTGHCGKTRRTATDAAVRGAPSATGTAMDSNVMQQDPGKQPSTFKMNMVPLA